MRILPLLALPLLVACDLPVADESLDVAWILDATGSPGAAACVVSADASTCGAAGLADARSGRRVQTDTAFLLASVSKTFTAAMALRQVEAGTLDLDAPVEVGFAVRHPSGATITPRALLAHTGGVDDSDAMDDFYTVGADPEIALDEAVRSYFDPAGSRYSARDNFTAVGPGAFAYSNMGSALVGRAVEVAGGAPFAALGDDLFDAADMANTSWLLGDFAPAELAAPHVDGAPIEHYTFSDAPNGGLRASAPDVGRFLRAVLGGGELDGQRLLTAASIAELHREHARDDGDLVGLGWFGADLGEPGWLGHDGGEEGVATAMYLHPERGVGFVVLLNGEGDVDAVLERLAADAVRRG